VTDIFREIDEELRRDNLLKLWQKYGRYLIALAVAVVAITAGVILWRDHQQWQRQEEGRQYADALAIAQEGKEAAAAAAMDELARSAGGGRAVLARLAEAALKAKAGDRAGAIATYDALAHDGSVDKVYRDMATLLGARYRLDGDDMKSVIDMLTPLLTPDNPWRPTALELTALAQLKSGAKGEARGAFETLAKDKDAPPALQQRAAQMVAALSQ
jgi:hypothetical protein